MSWQMWRAIREDRIDGFREDLINALRDAGRNDLAKEVDEWDYEIIEEVAIVNSWLSSYAAREILAGSENG